MIRLSVSGSDVRGASDDVLVEGAVGVRSEVTLDATWAGLDVTAYARSGASMPHAVRLGATDRSFAVPPAALVAGAPLRMGVSGVSPDGSVARPTAWATVGMVESSTLSARPLYDGGGGASVEGDALVMSGVDGDTLVIVGDEIGVVNG